MAVDNNKLTALDVMRDAPVIPVIVLNDVKDAIPLARALVAGGIHAGNAAEFLALSNLACVGGSWIVPTDAIQQGDWALIERLAREATQLAR